MGGRKQRKSTGGVVGDWWMGTSPPNRHAPSARFRRLHAEPLERRELLAAFKPMVIDPRGAFAYSEKANAIAGVQQILSSEHSRVWRWTSAQV